MPLFSYICPGCATSIHFDGTNGELCVLKHIRHSDVMGEVTGHYNGFGGILEEDKDSSESFYSLQGEGLVSRKEIAKSIFSLEDGEKSRSGKIYNGTAVNFMSFIEAKGYLPGWGSGAPLNQLSEEYKNLPLAGDLPKSGVEAWHKACYEAALQKEQNSHPISETAPDNGINYTRPEFM